MAIVTEGNLMGFIVFVACFIAFYYYVDQVRKGKELHLRRLPAIDAIDEMIGRCIETNRPVMFCAGDSGTLSSSVGPQLIAGARFCSYVADKCAELDARLVVGEPHQDLLPMILALVEEGYRKWGKEVPPGTVEYIPRGYSMTMTYAAMVRRLRPGANIMVGPFYHPAVLFAQAGAEVGAMQIAGTARSGQVAYFAAVADYPLIIEDIFAGAAYISGLPEQLGTIYAEDPFKIIAIILVFLTLILFNMNIPFLIDILKM